MLKSVRLDALVVKPHL